MSTVAVIRCENYDNSAVLKAVTRGIDLLGGAGRFAKRGQKVLLKPNFLIADPVEKCTNTHPAVFRAVAAVFRKTGAVLSYGDSPSFGSAEGVAKRCGILAVAEEMGIRAADFKNGDEIFFERGAQNKKFVIARGVLESDVVISLPKFKTHAFEKFTGSVKNQFGCIPGVRKGEYHIKLPDSGAFAQMLVDLNNFVKPALYVMDGVWAMEGNGPRGGKPRNMNVILVSDDPIALDATACRLIDLNPEYVPTIMAGSRSGSGVWRERDIDLRGDDIAGLIQPGFDIDRSPLKPYRERGFMRFVSNRLVPKPYIMTERCANCGVCVSMCPTSPKSVDWFDGVKSRPPTHNYKTCIRCYCCQEVCPESAIELKYPLVRRIFR